MVGMYDTVIIMNMQYPMIPNPFHIQRIQKETHDTFTMELIPANGNSILSFAPGQFNMLYVFGVGEVPISICGDPAKPETMMHTIRAVGTVTKAIQKLKRGDIIGVRGPLGSHWPMEAAKGNDVVMVTGGIGLAPLRPALYQLISQREQYGKIVLLYGARTPDDLLYTHELEQWRGRFNIVVGITVDCAQENWRGNVGVVTTLIPKAQFDPLHTVAMICGPELMMRFTIMELQKCGVKNKNIYISMERNMKCGIGLCGHCQCGYTFVCKDGPVFCYECVRELLGKREI